MHTFFPCKYTLKPSENLNSIAICKRLWTCHAKCYLHYQPTSKRNVLSDGKWSWKSIWLSRDHNLQKGLATILVLFFRMFEKCQVTPCWACKFQWHVTHLWSHMQVLYTYIAHHVYVFNYTYNAIVWCISNYIYMIMCLFLWAQVRSYIWNYI
jgi:hypothetical protein